MMHGAPERVDIEEANGWSAFRLDRGRCRLADFVERAAAWRFAVDCLQADIPTFWNGQRLGLAQARREARA